MPTVLRAIGAFAFGSLGGLIFLYLHFPLPWTLGSLSAVGLAAIFGSPLLIPATVRHVARPVVGVLAGSAFTAQVVANLALWWPVIPTVVLYTMITSLLGWCYFVYLCRFDRTTAVFASFPGGLGELTLLGGTLGADMRRLALVHSTRVITVIFCVPLLVQALIGTSLVGTDDPAAVTSKVGDPGWIDWLLLSGCGAGGYLLRNLLKPLGGAMVGALIFSAIVHGTGLTAAHPPDWLVAIVQVTIGAIVGSRLVGVKGRELGYTMLQGLGWAIALIALAALTALLASGPLNRTMPTLLLAFAPGGLMEMTLVAYAIGLEVAFVVTTQICRVVGSMILAPLLFRLLCGPPPTLEKT